MPNLAATLKEEIRRLARKEVRVQVNSTQKAAAQHRREIARLKRLLLDQQKKIAALEAQERRRVSEPAVSSDSLEVARFSIRSVKAQRRRLKLSAEEFGKLLGVSAQTVYNWEQGRTRPARAQFTALVELRKLGRREALQRLESL
jgi:DNA-binding transcriptional regulator YiaG